MGVSINGGFLIEHPIKMDDDWGYPYLRKPPYIFMSHMAMKQNHSERSSTGRRYIVKLDSSRFGEDRVAALLAFPGSPQR